MAELTLRKSGGALQPFEFPRLTAALRKAVRKGFTDAQLREVAQDVVADLQQFGAGEPIPSSRVGDAVLRVLKKFDQVSHIRFAIAFLGRLDRELPPGRTTMRDAYDFLGWLHLEYPELGIRLESRPAPRPPLTVPSVPPAPVSVPDTVIKRGPGRGTQGFEFGRLWEGIATAAKGRFRDDASLNRYAQSVAVHVLDELRGQRVVTTSQLGSEVLRRLRRDDDLAFIRYVAIFKAYDSAQDFVGESYGLLEFPSP